MPAPIRRLLITGGPRTGKTTLGWRLSCLTGWPLISTDDTLQLFARWSERVAFIADHWFDEPAPWIIEGVLVPYALRHFRKTNDSPPADLLIFLQQPQLALSQAQASMTTAIQHVYEDIRGFVPVPVYPLSHCQTCDELTDQPNCQVCNHSQLTPVSY